MRPWGSLSSLASCFRSTSVTTHLLANIGRPRFTLMAYECPPAFSTTLIRQRHKRSARAPKIVVEEYEDDDDSSDPDPSSQLIIPSNYSNPEEEFTALCEQYPQLQEYDPGVILQFLEFMSMHGFNSNKSAEMLLRLPSVLSSYEEQVPRATDAWRSLGYDEKDLTRVLFRHPQLIDYPISKIRTRYSFLAEFFSRKETLEAIVKNVQVIWDSEPVLEQKLNYLLKGVCHKAPSIVKTKALSYPFLHIRTRHEFLIRAGLFVPVSYYRLHKKSFAKDASVIREKYFTPADIICTHDKEFIRKCTKGLLTLNELATFEELFRVECEKNGLLDNDHEDKDSAAKGYSKSKYSSFDDDDEDSTEDLNSNSSSEFFNKKDSVEFYY